MPSSFEMPASFESIITFEKSEQKNALTSYYLKTIKSRLYRNGSRTVYICLDRSFQARIAGWNKEPNHFVMNVGFNTFTRSIFWEKSWPE